MTSDTPEPQTIVTSQLSDDPRTDLDFYPPDHVADRIEYAIDQYTDPESMMGTIEFERCIERAFLMVYEYEELVAELSPMDFHKCVVDTSTGAIEVYGKHVEPGDTVCFDDVLAVDLYDVMSGADTGGVMGDDKIELYMERIETNPCFDRNV
jgi:hypothetical protein